MLKFRKTSNLVFFNFLMLRLDSFYLFLEKMKNLLIFISLMFLLGKLNNYLLLEKNNNFNHSFLKDSIKCQSNCYTCNVSGCGYPYFYRSYYSQITSNCSTGCYVSY